MPWCSETDFASGLRVKGLKREVIAAVAAMTIFSACGPRAHIPVRPTTLPHALAATDSGAALARRLAPILYLQADEMFPLSRAVAILHPEHRLVAYHLLWRDDVHGSWIPFTVPTDQEIVWVGYDPSGAPTDVWTYWHGLILHTAWPRAQVAINVQWGKHGSLPRGLRESDLPRSHKLNFYYAASYFLLPDILLGDVQRKGPLCFCGSYDRYRDFSKTVVLGERLDAVIKGGNPHEALLAFFGPYSMKPLWPPGF